MANIELLANYVSDGYATNGVQRNEQYQIPDVVLRSPTVRKLRIITIGSGLVGIMHSYYIQKELENVEYVVYEKNPDIGGTWYENRYPGCACDVASHAYQFPFALYPDWPSHFSSSADIWKYLDKVCNTFDLRDYMNFNSEVSEAKWDDDAGEWNLTISQTRPDGSTHVFGDRCHVLLYGTGYKDQKTGRVTAVWPGSSLHYTEALKTPRFEDFDIEYYGPSKNNRWAYLGMGVTREYVEKRPDLSPWLQRETLDPKWLKAVGIDHVKLLEDQLAALRVRIEGAKKEKDC